MLTKYKFTTKVALSCFLSMLVRLIKCSVTGFLIGVVTIGQTQVNLTSTSYSQNFDSLSATGTANTWSNNTTLSGWYAFREMPVGTYNPIAQYNATSSSQQALYSFGSQTGPTSGDRALGSIAGQSSSIGGTFYLGLGFTNALTQSITDAAITYQGETWWVGSASLSTVQFQFSLNATGVNDQTATWTDFDNLDLTAVTGLPTGASNGNSNAVSKSGILSNLALANGSTLWLRWVDFDAPSGTEFGLGVDDLSINFTTASGGGGDITTTPEPFTMALTGLGAAAVLRRKLKAKQKPATS